MTRVLLLFTTSQLGGAERSLSRMALHPDSMDFQLATLGRDGPWCKWVRSFGNEPIVYGERGNWISQARAISQDIKRLRIDVVYVCGLRASLLLRFLLLRHRKVKLVHGVRWNPSSDSRLDRNFRRLETRLHRMVSGFITNSEAACTTLKEQCGVDREHIAVIYNGIELPPEDPPAGRRAPEVLTVANLNHRKGHLEYLDTICQVLERLPDTKFIFVGRDDMNGQVQKRISELALKDSVQCLGFQEDVTQWYQRARVFVLPSKFDEGAPTSVLEAMAHAIPCVAFAIDGIPELISSGSEGTLISSGNYQAMAEAIVDLLTQDNLASSLGARARQKAETEFSLQTMIKQHGEFLASLVSEGRT